MTPSPNQTRDTFGGRRALSPLRQRNFVSFVKRRFAVFEKGHGQGHSTNLFLTLSVPQRNRAGWQNCRCFDELAGQFFAVEGLVLEVMMFCSIGSIFF